MRSEVIKASLHPPFSWQLVLRAVRPASPPPPLDQPRVRFYFRASNAIWNGVKLLEIAPDANILFPSYHCGIELDTILKAAARVKFYGVGRDLALSPELIERQIDARTRAVFVTHYFGFPQGLPWLREICDRRGLYLIEDCAHALYSRSAGQPLGTLGDIAVFSMWKTVPIPFGGALVVNNPSLRVPSEETAASAYEVLRVTKILLELRLRRSWLGDQLARTVMRSLAGVVRRSDGRLVEDRWRQRPVDFAEFAIERATWGMPGLSRRMLPNASGATIVRRRRAHFQTLLDVTRQAKGVRPLYADLPAGVCPLYFPVTVEHPKEFVAFMAARSVNASWFWCEFHPDFPQADHAEAVFLKTHVVALPIQQALTRDGLSRVHGGLRDWAAGAAGAP